MRVWGDRIRITVTAFAVALLAGVSLTAGMHAAPGLGMGEPETVRRQDATATTTSGGSLVIGDPPTPTPMPTPTPVPGLDDNSFVHPWFGWSITWTDEHPATVTSVDTLRIGPVTLETLSRDTLGSNPRIRLDDARSCLASGEVDILYDGNGNLMVGPDSGDAWMVWQTNAIANSGVHYVRCIVLEPGVAMLRISADAGNKERFNQEVAPLLDTILANLVLPEPGSVATPAPSSRFSTGDVVVTVPGDRGICIVHWDPTENASWSGGDDCGTPYRIADAPTWTNGIFWWPIARLSDGQQVGWVPEAYLEPLVTASVDDGWSEPYQGVWEGEGIQTGVDAPIEVRATLGGGEIGDQIGLIEYPNLGCVGTARLMAINDQSIEIHISILPGRCYEEADAVLTRNDDGTLQFEWYHPDDGVVRIDVALARTAELD